jgi:thiol-disulfide isomerase/thioredoxin
MKTTNLAAVGMLLTLAGCHREEPKGKAPAPTETSVAPAGTPAPMAKPQTPDSEPGAPPLDEVLAKAKTEGKPILLEFSTGWCHPCQMFKKDYLPMPEVQQALSAYVFQVYDAEHGNGATVAAKYKVNGFPTFLIVDEHGEVHDRQGGLGEASQWVHWAKAGQVMALSEAQIKARLEKTSVDAQTLYAAGRWHLAHDHADLAIDLFDRASKADADGKAGVQADAAWEHDELARDVAGSKLMADDAARYLARFPRSEHTFQALDRVLATNPPRATAEKLIHQVGEGVSPKELNDLVYTALAVGALDEALALGQRMVKDSKQANEIDTLAEVYNFRGEKKLALETEDRALALASPADKSALEANRKRYETGATTPSDVDQYKGMIRRAGQKPRAAADKKDDNPMPNMPPAMAEMQAFGMALNGMTNDLAGKCKEAAGDKEDIYVLFYVNADGGAPTKALVVDPEAPAAVAGCLSSNLGAVSLPKAPASAHGRAMSKMHFAKG